MTKTRGAKLRYLSAMGIFGTIGLFVRSIPLSSGVIAMARGFIGAAFLALVMLLRRQKPALDAVRQELGALILTGMLIGFNWILLFESYRFTSVATGTLCYYLAPTFVVLTSPLTLHEKLTKKKLLCAAAALIGMVFVSGMAEGGLPSRSEARGIFLGVGAAVLYAAIITMSKSIRKTPAFDKTIVQLLSAAVVLVPYNLLSPGTAGGSVTPLAIGLLIFVGIIHTGLAYTFYFGAITEVPLNTAAIFGYIDPIVAVLLSWLVLHEGMSVGKGLGAALLIGAALWSELPSKKEA